LKEELKVIITAELSKFKKELDEGKKEIKTFKERVKEAGENVDDTMKKAGEGVKAGTKAMAVGVTAAATAMVALVASTKEYRQTQAQLQTAFETAGATAEDAKQTYNDLYRVLGDSGQAGEAAQHLAQLTNNEKDLAQWTDICQGVYATFGASLPIESLTEASNETAKVGTVTGALADALNWAGVSEDAFNEKLAACNTEAEREALIRKTLNGIYSEASAEYEKNNASILAQNEAQASLDESLASLSATLEPIVAQLTAFAALLVEQLVPHLQNALAFVEEHKVALGIIAGVIAGVVTAIGLYNAVAAVKAAMDAAQVTTIWGLVAAHAAQAAAAMVALAPYLLIVAAIAAVIAVIVLCIKYWDEIVAAVKNAIDFIVEFLTPIGTWIYDNVIAPVVKFFQDLWENIVNGFHTVIDPWIEIIKRAATLIYDTVIKPIADFFAQLWETVAGFFGKIWDGLKNGAKAAWEGVKSIFAPVAEFFGNIFKKAWEKVKAVFSVGGKIFDGIKDGIVSVFKAVVNGIITGINKVVAVPFNAINKVLSTLNGLEILGVKPFSWVHTFTVPQIPKLARGGIVDGATLAMVGEQGKEAVIPLENNTEWLDKLANMLASKTGGRRPIVLKLGEKVLAETMFSAWNSYVDQTGNCPVNVW
jgi:phage-related protein